MAGRTITLKYPGTCRDCGTSLPAGTRARWYGRGVVYCNGTHGGTDEPLGQTLSRRDPGGLYTPGGRLVGRASCNCEDFPCCGH